MRKPQKIIVMILLSCLILSIGFPLFAEDKIVAIVNKDAVTQKDLDEFLNFMRMQLSRQLKGKELEKKIDSIKEDLLQRLIEDRLILQEAKKALEEAKNKKDLYAVSRLEVEPARIRSRITELKKNFGSEADFQREIMGQGITQADLEKKLKEQLLMRNIIDYKIRKKIMVRPEEVTDFYNTNPAEFSIGEEREFDVAILDNLDLAKTVSFNLKSGQKLLDMATVYPMTVDKIKLVKGREEFRKDIEEIAFKMNAGDISNPIQIEAKFYVLILNSILPPRQISLHEAQDKIYTFLQEKKLQQELVKWLDEIKQNSFIKIM